MCNLYKLTPRNDLEVYIRRHATSLALPDADPPKAFVGPFDTGLFLRPAGADGLEGVLGQWGMIRPGAPARKDMMVPKAVPGRKAAAPRPRQTNNCRTEGMEKAATFRASWSEGRRCLIPAEYADEPNWQLGKNVWWHLRRADGFPLMLAGLWNEWLDQATGEIVPSYTLLTMNCDGHPFLSRLHKPDPTLPDDAQDKRAVIHIPEAEWGTWLYGRHEDARALFRTPPPEFFDQTDAKRMDELLAGSPGLF